MGAMPCRQTSQLMPTATTAPPANASVAMTVVGVPTLKEVPRLGPSAVIRRSGLPTADMAETRATGPSRLTRVVR